MSKDARIDAYVAKSPDFARPIVKTIRAAVREGCPDVEESVKWGHPSFSHEGMLCGIAVFKAHCTFGFWKDALLRERASAAQKAVLDRLGRMESEKDLPPKKSIVALVKAAAQLNASGVKLERKVTPKEKRVVVVPKDLAAALKKNAKARATFEAFSYSCKKEYVEWIEEAKRDETRARRLTTAIEWLSQGKKHSWRYEERAKARSRSGIVQGRTPGAPAPEPP